MTPQNEALRLLEDALKTLESPQGSVLSSVQKLSRASTLLGNQDVHVWCAIQLGEKKYTRPLQKIISIWIAKKSESVPEKVNDESAELREELNALNLKQEIHYSMEELKIKRSQGGGGYISIGIVEEQYANLIRTKKGNDGTYYQIDLYNHLDYVRKKAHNFASSLFNQVKFAGTISNCFDLLKQAIDDRLLDLNPTLAEQLMLAFKGISSNNQEEWSQALTTCRRFLEGLADELQPAGETSKGRLLSQGQYVNRLWAFMDEAIESDTNKDLAKAHVDFLGSWMEKTNKIANKGVHAEVGQLESIKAVFHTYLVIADILEYLGKSQSPKPKPDLNTATLDDLEALLDVKRAIAKEIVKSRVKYGRLDRVSLQKVRGVGPKTLEKAIEVFSI
jgi:DNA uptake protein ComE-like DNA-binding protein